MKRKIISLAIAVVLILSAVITVSAAELPEDYCYLTLDGMDRVTITSSSAYNTNEKYDTSLILDHLTGTGNTFVFTKDKFDPKTVSIIFASREREKVEKFALLVEHDEVTSVEVSLFVTNDPEFATWMPVSIDGDGEKDGWKIVSTDGLESGFAYYRITFKVIDGTSFSLKEAAFFRTAEDKPAPKPADSKPAAKTDGKFEPEMWMKMRGLARGGLFR